MTQSNESRSESGPATQETRRTPRKLVIGKPPLPRWVYIVSELVDDKGTRFVLNVDQNEAKAGQHAIIWPLEEDSPNELWQFSDDGRIITALNHQLVLSLDKPYDPDNGYVMIVDTQRVPNDDSQLFDSLENSPTPGQIRNRREMEYLTVAGGTKTPIKPKGGELVISAPGISNPSYKWRLMPSCPLDKILQQDPVPFPAFSGGQKAAYDYVDKQLGIRDLRQQYLNLDAPLESWQNKIGRMDPPVGVSPADWSAVKEQLDEEITRVIAVQKLFQNYNEFHDALFADNGALLTKLGTDVGLEEGSKDNTIGLLDFILSSVFATVLGALPGGGAVFGNIFNTAVGIATLGSNVKNPINPDPFQVAYSELWNMLSRNFLGVREASDAMSEQLLSDWGMLQAAYAAILSQGEDSLAWPDGLTSKLLNASVPGYSVAILQTLMPTRYQIYSKVQTNDKPLPGVPDEAQWARHFLQNIWIKYWIGDIRNITAYPAKEVMRSDIWDNGVSKADFFLGARGWNFAQNPVPDERANVQNCDLIAITVANQTPNVVHVYGKAKHGKIDGSSDFVLPPYQSMNLTAHYVGALEIEVNVVDPNVSQSPFATFVAHQHGCVAEAGKVWVDNLKVSGKYKLSSPACHTGSEGQGYGGTVQVTIYPSPKGT